MFKPLGTKVPRYAGPPVPVIGAIERSQTGNVILRVGLAGGDGWHQTEHIVLDPGETLNLIAELIARLQENGS